MNRQFHRVTDWEREAFRVLGLAEPVEQHDVDAVDQRWRELRGQLHPDRGGDPAAFAAAKRCYDIARFVALEPKPCLTCNGSAKVERPSRGGLSFMTLNCPTCRGSGLR